MKSKMLDAAGFLVTWKEKTSILFEDRFANPILQVRRIVGYRCTGVYFLLKSLSHVHHAVF